MKKIRWQILVVVIALITVGVLLITQRSSPLGTVLPEPAVGGTYVEGLIGSFGRLNPLLDWSNPADRAVDNLIFSRLIRFDSQGNPRSDLAESWGVSEDGMIYNVSLRRNALWEDGQPITSDDVIYTISLMQTEFSMVPADIKAMWSEIQIKRLDDYTLQFLLPEPYAPFLDHLSIGILPKHILETTPADQLIATEFNLDPVGSGPYRLEELVITDGQVTGIILVLSENYYGQKPFIEQIEFRYFPNAYEAYNAYQQGDILGISELPPELVSLACGNLDLNCYTSRMPALSMVLFNLDNQETAFFGEKNVRKALLLGLNRQLIVNDILGGQAIIADSPILPGTWAYYNGIQSQAYDPGAAEKLLAAAGFILPAGENVRNKDGVLLAFTLIHPDDEQHTRIAEQIRNDWLEIGVQVTLQAIPYDSLVMDHLEPRAYQAALVDLDLSHIPDPDPYPFWHQSQITGGQNYSQWDNRSASEYLEQARVIFDRAVRARLYRNFQAVFNKETPAVLLFYPTYTYAADARVNGVQLAPIFESSDRFDTIADWYLLTQRASDTVLPGTSAP